MIAKAKSSTSPTTINHLPTAQLRHYAEINPPTVEFTLIPPGDPVTFMSLDTVWPDGHADVGVEITWTGQSHSYTPFRRGDVLLPKVSPTFSMGRATVADTPHPVGLASSEVYVLRPRENADARFIAYAVRSTDFLAEGTASQQGVGGLRRVSSGWVGSYRFPQYDLPTQRRIADYLDRETAQIDAMAGALDGLVARLKERKETFVKSLLNDPDYDCVPTKLKHLATSENHLRIPLSSTERGSMQGTVPYYGASGVIDYVSEPIWTNTERLLVSEDGANLTARNHPIAFVARGDFWVNNHAHILATHPNVPPHLVAEIINLTDISNHISGSAQPKLTSASLWEISVPFPREHSQRLAMNQKIESETAKIDAMIAKAGELRALLDERRSALITATVTGQHPVPKEP
ncbi:hypothetical protein [Corynebacterium sp.]|uniref:hypothetical protein n=1 Tax=Corynebacterium sp. TaxID=1720 RepID=UPI0026DD75BB|nr:hypothetical protein [Corynebacterium sp.]MDO4609646.1 hypothetical protein [Corynebacterium sp.]